MATNYAIRVTRAYQDVEPAVVACALLADKVLAYEHVGTATEKVHIHLLLIGVRCDKKTLQKKMNERLKHKLIGNGDWSFKTKDKNYGDVEDSVKYITYMTKGKHDAKYNKGYTDEELATAKALWVEPVRQKSKWSKWFAEFELMISPDLPKTPLVLPGLNQKETYPGYDEVRRKATAFIFEKTGELRKHNRSDAKDMVITYCYKHKVATPKNIEDM